MTKKKSSKKQNSYDHSTFNKPITAKPTKYGTNSNSGITGIKGLVNLGNTCYFNSMLQMLINSPDFMTSLNAYCSTDYTILAKMSDNEYKLILKTSDVSTVEKELISLWESDKSISSPSSLRSALLQHKEFKAHFNGFNEQDSHEVFLMVLNIIKEAQIKRVRGAVLDHFNCRHQITKDIDEDARKKIKEVSAAVEKQILVNNLFGIVIGSNLKCQRCGELRMRFDEVLHIAPSFPANCRSDEFDSADSVPKATAAVDKTDGTTAVVLEKAKPRNELAPEKASKHQQKRQKRIEKKAARNKKSVIRNINCSEDLSADIDGTVTENTEEHVDEHVDNKMEESTITELLESNGNDDMEYPIVFGGHSPIEPSDTSLVMQQLVMDTICQQNRRKTSSQCSSSNDSMLARKNDSSHVSLTSMTSADLEMFVEDEFSLLSVEDENNIDKLAEEDDAEKYYTAENTLSVSNEQIEEEENSDVDNIPSARQHIARDDTEEINQNNDNGDTEMRDEQEACDSAEVCEVTSCCGDKKFMQTVYSATLDTHQDNLFSINHSKVLYEQPTDLDRALTVFNSPMFLENIVCENCSKSTGKIQTDHFKSDVICHLPQILPFYISRFKQTAARNRTKNNQVYSYPFVLNLSSQCSKYANFNDNSSPVLYRLFGIIEHIGARINSGHYVSYVSRRKETAEPATSPATPPSRPYPVNILSDISRKYSEEQYKRYEWKNEFCDGEETDPITDDPSDYQWYRISDSQIDSVTSESVRHIQAFMLFYSRIQ